MDAIVLAGGLLSPDDPLFPEAPHGLKALLDVEGKPMVQWVLDALCASGCIERVVVVGLPANAEISCTQPWRSVDEKSDVIRSVKAAADTLADEGTDAEYVVVVSADAPAIRGEMVAWLAGRVAKSDHDFLMCVVERSTMERRFPDARRTYLRFRDRDVCGGDMAACRLSAARGAGKLAAELSRSRKHPLRQAMMIGFGTLLLLLTRRLTLDSAVRRVGSRLGIDACALVCPYAEVAMDVDKPSQLAAVRSALAAQD